MNSDEIIKNGTRVNILHSHSGPGRIVEYRGRLAPGGVRVYGIRVGRKPSHYVEIPETYLEIIPSTDEPTQPTSDS